MNLDSSAYLAIGAWCAWYSAAAMILLYGVYRMLTDDEIKRLAAQVAVAMRYAEQSNLFLETLNEKLKMVPIPSKEPQPKSAIELAYNRRKDDPTQTEQK